MDVWVVLWAAAYEGQDLLGVYATKEAALADWPEAVEATVAAPTRGRAKRIDVDYPATNNDVFVVRVGVKP